MKELDLPFHSFMGGYYMPEDVCDFVVNYFKKNKDKHIKGKIGQDNINEDVKKSTEIEIATEEEYKDFDRYLFYLQECLDRYKEKYVFADKSVVRYGIITPTKIQHYKPGEGFYQYHIENPGFYVKGSDPLILSRHLTFMTYLNTVDNAGTEFLYQEITTPCQKGLTVIWPAGWTHPHRGVVNNNLEKYIITGWYNFLPDAQNGVIDSPSFVQNEENIYQSDRV